MDMRWTVATSSCAGGTTGRSARRTWKSWNSPGSCSPEVNRGSPPLRLDPFAVAVSQLALFVFMAATMFLFAEIAIGRGLGVVNAMLHRLGGAKEGEDGLEVVIV